MEYKDADISRNSEIHREEKYIATMVKTHRCTGQSTQILLQKDITGVFDNFYIPFLSFFENKLRNSLPSILKYPVQIDIDTVVTDATAVLKRRLMAIASKALITEIHSWKKDGKLEGNDQVERYNYFNAQMLAAPILLSILDRYPVLSYLFYITIFSTLAWLQEIISNFSADYSKIKARFSLNSSKIKGLLLGLGDSHNDGKAVSIFVMDGGERLVYKPHVLSTEMIFVVIVDWLNNTGKLKEKLISADVLNGKGYGWQECIEPKPCQDGLEAERYFYRIGVLLALLHICKAVDIHSENLMACGEHPVVVDLETLFSNKHPLSYQDGMFTIFLREVNDSVLGTMLLPQNFPFSTFDLDVSALSGEAGNESKRIRVNSIVNWGTDDIRIKDVYYVTEEHTNRATLKGHKLSPLNYCQDIEEGFSDCYQLISILKREFLELIYSFSAHSYRQIIRPTHVYYKFIEASYHPKYLRSFDARYKLLEILYGEGHQGNGQVREQAEIEAILKNNVPYFTADFTTTNLYTGSGHSIPSFFDQPLLEILENRIKGLNSKSMQRQLDYIKMSLLTTENTLWQGRNIPEVDNIRHQKVFSAGDSFLESACKIGDYFCETAIYGPANKECTWLTLLISKQQSFEMSAVNYSIYEGSGVVLFLACLGKETGDAKYTDLARAALRGIEVLYHPHKTESPLPSSAYWGIGSLVYLYYNLAILWDDGSQYEKYKNFLKVLSEDKMLEEESLDFLGGLAGVVTLLINIYLEEKDNVLLDLACRYGEVLYRRSKDEDQMLTGLSHGYAGISFALIFLGRTAGIKKYIEYGRELIDKENTYYDPLNKNWLDLRQPQDKGDGESVYWCHGAAGIGLARAMIAELVEGDINDKLDSDIQAAIDKTFECGFAGNGYSLCHGQFGNLDILLKISSMQRAVPGLKEKIYFEANGVVERVCANGLPYQTLGFMLGLSGIGYVLLRLVNRNYPSVLALDVTKREDQSLY